MKSKHHYRKLREAPPPPPLDEIADIIAEAVKRLAALRPPSGTKRKNILQETGYKDVIVL